MNSHPTPKAQHQPREKRLKVSRACFTCRVKKIKCDGVQPCMQCKARRRPCSFSKDGTVDETQQSPDAYPATHSSMEDDSRQPHSSTSHSSPTTSTSKKRPFPMEEDANHVNLEQQKSKEQDDLSKTFQQLERLSMMWPGEGKEGRWLVDINLLFNGAEESTLNESTQPPSASFLNLNNNLLALFFRHRHTIFPILPKSIFYRLLEHRDALITPLLLNSMYCNAAHYSHQDAPDADSYFRKAEALLDAYIDTPNLSLVISLCLLSTFESNRYGTGPPIGRSKARIYRDMACRMCYDLKLHKRYSFHNTGATPDDIELRKRAYWVCYCLDKVQSLVTGKPYLLSCKDIDIDFPVVLGTDDSSEFDVNTCFVEHIKLMQISERVLQLEIPDRQAGLLRSPENEQLVLDLDGQLLYWLRNLPPSLQWTPLNNTNNDMIPTQPPQNALVAHLHLVFNYLQISVLQPIASTSLSSSPASLIIQQRCASVATNLTQLTCAMAEQPTYIISFTFMAEAIMAALRVHIMNCADEKASTARHARFMFQRSLRSMRAILQHRVLDRIQDFATTIEKALVDADTGNSSSRNSSPKIHVLSPIIPRTSASASTHNTMAPMPMDPYANVDDRWPARANNSNGLMPYGLVSPTSSTASAPLEKSAMSRDEDIARPHSSLSQINHVYSHLSPSTSMTTSAPLMDPYSRPAFQIPASSASTPTAWRSPAVSPNHSNSKVASTPNQEQQQMEMYSNIWSRTSLENGLQQFSSDHLDNSFINSTRQHIRQEKEEKQHFETATSTTSSSAMQATANSFHTPVSNADSNNTAVGSGHMTADSELYSLWDQQANKNNNTASQQQQQATMLTTPQPQPTTGSRYGLGVYASAQQHHTDVIRQHMPDLKPSNSNRPVLLNHHGQVVVAGANQSNHSMH